MHLNRNWKLNVLGFCFSDICVCVCAGFWVIGRQYFWNGNT